MILSRTKSLTSLLRHYELTSENASYFLTNQSKTKTFIDLKVTRNPKTTKIAHDLILMRFLRILLMRSRQKVMTSSALIDSCQVNEIPAYFIHEIKTKGCDVIGVYVFLRKLMRFLRKKEVNFIPPLITYLYPTKYWKTGAHQMNWGGLNKFNIVAALS